MTIITPQDHERIRETIASAEKRTAGEIYCVMARRSDDYLLASAAMVLVATLVTSQLLALVADFYRVPVDAITIVTGQFAAVITAFVLLQIFPALRIFMVPNSIRFRRAHRNASEQFLARNIHLTKHRTGVLIFVSLAEHYAEIVADTEIDRLVDQEKWNEIVADLITYCRNDQVAEGFIGAITQAGILLAEHFPPQADDKNELDDHLIEL